MTYRIGIIGDPVAHSRSPLIHNAAFAAIGFPAQYERWFTPAAELPERIGMLQAPEFLGANVTLPHKIAVMSLLDQITPVAAAIGAVNTIVRQPNGQLLGDNTDAPGFLDDLLDAGFQPTGRAAVILGASGAARAAVAVLLQAGVQQLVVVNRTPERAEQLLADLIEFAPGEPLLRALGYDDPELADTIATADLLVNATSLGWHPGEMPLDANLLTDRALVYDMVYHQTQLLQEAQARGAAVRDGLGMLVRQAARGFQLWTGQTAPIDVMFAALRPTEGA